MACALLEGENCKFDELKKQVRLARTARAVGHTPSIKETEQPIKNLLKIKSISENYLIYLGLFLNYKKPSLRKENGTCRYAKYAAGQAECGAYIKVKT
jgi:hypothetical protein